MKTLQDIREEYDSELTIDGEMPPMIYVKCGECGNDNNFTFGGDREFIDYYHNHLRDIAQTWIKKLADKSNEHWKKLEEYGFVGFPETEDEDAFSFEVDGIRLEEHYEANDAEMIIEWIKHFFNLDEQ